MTTRMKVYEALARAFAAEGTTDVFGLMGDGNMYWMNALHDLGVTLYEVRHEGAGLAMADGYARISGKVGVCTATHGPGVSQLATTMLVAARAHTPLVAFCGEQPAGDDEFGQRLDNERFAAAIEAGFVRVTSADNADYAVRKAFYLAKLESRPIMLSVPANVQMHTYDDSDEYEPSSTLLPRQLSYPHPQLIEQAVETITQSKQPVIVVGRGAVWSGAGDEVLKLAKRIGALIATTLLTKTYLSEDEFHAGISGLYSTRTAMELFQDADCVIAVGAGLNKYTTEHGYLYPNAKYIQLDAKPHVLMGGGRSADTYIQTDARLGVEGLNRALEARSFTATGYRTAEVKARLAESFLDPQEYELEPGVVDPRAAILTLDEALPSDIGLVMGGGAQVGFGTITFTRQRQMMLMNQHFGCIGQGITTAMGAVVASGNPAFLVDGDAGLMMHLAEFETAVRYDLPLMIVVMNDQALGAEYHKSRAHHMKEQLATISTPDLGKVATAMGGRGYLVTDDLGELRKASDNFASNPGPTMVDVRISRNVLSIPYRRLHFGQDA
jgi:acetolactate synthase I/II/III large subunit